MQTPEATSADKKRKLEFNKLQNELSQVRSFKEGLEKELKAATDTISQNIARGGHACSKANMNKILLLHLVLFLG